jgi:hypothetical protein
VQRLGCVQTGREPGAHDDRGKVMRRYVMQVTGDSTTLLVTRAGDTAAIGWISKADYTYTILYSGGMSAKAPWQVVPGAERIDGTGEQINFTDKVPKDEPRYYRLQIEKK